VDTYRSSGRSAIRNVSMLLCEGEKQLDVPWSTCRSRRGCYQASVIAIDTPLPIETTYPYMAVSKLDSWVWSFEERTYDNDDAAKHQG
jgi:hypothetical protein